jgi:hypothetical protein
MRKILDTTDKKHVGEVIDEKSNPVVFANGDKMQVVLRLYNDTVLANSNYIIVLSPFEEKS